MKKIMKIVAFVALTALAFTSSNAMAEFDKSLASAGAGYGFGNSGVLSFRGDYDISGKVDKPVKVRVGYDRYSIDSGLSSSYTWSYNVLYAGAYYDFNEMFDLDTKIHPFAGLGFGFGSVSCSGALCSNTSSPSIGDFYYISGVQYGINEQFSADASFSVWGGLTLGANYHF